MYDREFFICSEKVLKTCLNTSVFNVCLNPPQDLNGLSWMCGLVATAVCAAARSPFVLWYNRAGLPSSICLVNFVSLMLVPSCLHHKLRLRHTKQTITYILHHQNITGSLWPMAGQICAYAPRLSILKWFFIAGFIYSCLNVLWLSPLASYVNMLLRRWH